MSPYVLRNPFSRPRTSLEASCGRFPTIGKSGGPGGTPRRRLVARQSDVEIWTECPQCQHVGINTMNIPEPDQTFPGVGVLEDAACRDDLTAATECTSNFEDACETMYMSLVATGMKKGSPGGAVESKTIVRMCTYMIHNTTMNTCERVDMSNSTEPSIVQMFKVLRIQFENVNMTADTCTGAAAKPAWYDVDHLKDIQPNSADRPAVRLLESSRCGVEQKS
ncbi:hypothetical protein MAR_027367 [Mya arenaria]|uniref:Uncharacterized protein n=1 Tax=Mya arenaria TaxID=6604 RepID=A0ABY7EVB8_MYAAR|nr:hypothetical protein MAR_027367 [Mya arenaria]